MKLSWIFSSFEKSLHFNLIESNLSLNETIEWSRAFRKRLRRRLNGISCSSCLAQVPVFPPLSFFRALSQEDSKRARFISRFPNPLYETRVVYRAVLHHLSTLNLPWNVMKHAVVQWLDPSKLHAKQRLSRPIWRGCILAASMISKDDETSRREWRENQHVRAFSQLVRIYGKKRYNVWQSVSSELIIF